MAPQGLRATALRLRGPNRGVSVEWLFVEFLTSLSLTGSTVGLPQPGLAGAPRPVSKLDGRIWVPEYDSSHREGVLDGLLGHRSKSLAGTP